MIAKKYQPKRGKPLRSPKKAAPAVAMVRKEVAKQISKAQENKLAMKLGKATNAVGSSFVEYIYPRCTIDPHLRGLLPPVIDGTDTNQRVGNSISPKVLKIRGLVYINWAITQSTDFTVRMMVLTNKTVKDQTQLTQIGTADFAPTILWDGQASPPTATAYQGCQPYYNQLPINRRQWNVLFDRPLHLRKSLMWPGSGGGPQQSTVYPNHGVPFEFVLTAKHLPAKLQYASGLGNSYPTNFAPVLAMGWTDNTGGISVGDPNQDEIVSIQWTSSLIYEDS